MLIMVSCYAVVNYLESQKMRYAILLFTDNYEITSLIRET